MFGGRAEVVEIVRRKGDTPIAIHGLSFAQPHAPESLIVKYKPAVEGAINIGVLHTSLAGAPGHDPYSPCSLADLAATGFNYWALGHIHKRSVVEGRCAIVMPGMPQGRDINETGSKSVTLVTIADDRSIRIEERTTSVAQFERVCTDVTNIDNWTALVREIGRSVEQARDGLSSEQLVVRLRLTGTTPLAWRIRRDLDLLKTELDHRAAVIGASWVEKLETDCHAPGAMGGLSDNPLTELHRLINEVVVRSDAFQMDVKRIAEELRDQLPPECRTILGSDEATFDRALAGLVTEGADDVLARLHAGAEAGES